MDIRSLEITAEFLKLITEIDEFKGSWKALQSLSPERLQSLQRVATIESIGSSTRIEGAKLSDNEVEKLLQGLQSHSFASRDEEEVVGYAQAIELVHESYPDIAISENYIKQLHRELLRYSSKDEPHRGEYKKFPNNVEAFDADGKSIGVVFETSSPFDTPRKMQELVDWTKSVIDDESYHPLIVTAVFVVTFLAIHPFQDGNGRLSRILTSLILLKSGYSYFPYSSMESIIERNKENYYLSLRRTQTTLWTEDTNWTPWLRFFLQSLKRQKDHLKSKVDMQIEKDFLALPSESQIILDYVAKHGRINTSKAQELVNIPRPTVRLRLSQLVEKGLLELHGKGRGAFYVKTSK